VFLAGEPVFGVAGRISVREACVSSILTPFLAHPRTAQGVPTIFNKLCSWLSLTDGIINQLHRTFVIP